MRWLIALAFLAGCGTDDPPPDFITSGIRVYTNGFDISSDSIDMEVREVETQINLLFADQGYLDLPTLAENYRLTLKYVLRSELPENVRGIYEKSNDSIKVNYVEVAGETTVQSQCVETYYVFGHELMHFVAARHLGVSDLHNAMHFTEYLFFTSAHTYDCVEYYVLLNTVYHCYRESPTLK